MTEYLHKVRPVEIVELKPGEYKDDRPFIEHKDHRGSMYEPVHPFTQYNDVDVKLSNGDIHYCKQAGHLIWGVCSNPYVIAYRKADTAERWAALGKQLEQFYGKPVLKRGVI